MQSYRKFIVQIKASCDLCVPIFLAPYYASNKLAKTLQNCFQSISACNNIFLIYMLILVILTHTTILIAPKCQKSMILMIYNGSFSLFCPTSNRIDLYQRSTSNRGFTVPRLAVIIIIQVFSTYKGGLLIEYTCIRGRLLIEDL